MAPVETTLFLISSWLTAWAFVKTLGKSFRHGGYVLLSVVLIPAYLSMDLPSPIPDTISHGIRESCRSLVADSQNAETWKDIAQQEGFIDDPQSSVKKYAYWFCGVREYQPN